MSDSTYADMIEIVYERVLEEMKKEEIPDTTENRIAMLEGLRDGWEEEDGDNPDAVPWIIAVTLELTKLNIKRFNEVVGIK